MKKNEGIYRMSLILLAVLIVGIIIGLIVAGGRKKATVCSRNCDVGKYGRYWLEQYTV